MIIGSRSINEDVLIVAEVGNNHEGRLEIAEELVRQAARAGAQAVKFQTFRADLLVDQSDPVRYERLKKFELTPAQFTSLSRLAHSLGLLFISTPLDLPSADALEPIVDAFKVASGDITFLPLIARLIHLGKPLILSTGASTLAEVDETVSYARDHYRRLGKAEQLALLHCVSCYPAPPEAVNLRAIGMLQARFQCPVGYSDHTLGIEAVVCAVAAGARIIEKHFTLDKNFSDFRDHALSATPEELSSLVSRVRGTQRLLGRPEKQVQVCEGPMVTPIRRSIAAAHPMPKGHRVAWSDLVWLRPASGLRPGSEDLLVGHRLKRALSAGDRLRQEDVEST